MAGSRGDRCERNAGLASPLGGGSPAFALLVEFVVPVPVHPWLIVRGQGYAVVHPYHH